MNPGAFQSNASPPDSATPPAAGFRAAQWVVGLMVFGLIGYPVVRWATQTDDRTVAVVPAIPVKAQTLLNQAFSLYQAQRFEESVAVGKALVQEFPNVANGWNNLGTTYGAMGKWDDAIQCERQALKIEPAHGMAKGNLEYFLKAKAGGVPQQGATPAAASLQELLNLSSEYYRTNKLAECVDAAGQATRLDPHNSNAFNNLGVCYAAVGLFDRAIQVEQEAVRLDSENQLAKNNLAYSLQQKKIRDAVSAKK